MKRVVALHTSAALVSRIQELWAAYDIPAKLINIIDDSLIWEVIDQGGPTLKTRKRLLQYALSAEAMEADLIFNTCSSVGGVADMIQPFCGVPIVKIDQPMAKQAIAMLGDGGTIGVLATLPTTLPPTVQLVQQEILKSGKSISITQAVADGAFQKLMDGKRAEHDGIVVDRAMQLAAEVDGIILAQGSMAALEQLIAERTGKPVFSSPESGVRQFLDLV